MLLLSTPLWGQGGLADASLEQLLETRVTTVSKKAQSLSRTAAAVFVIGPEDIRRSGALSLPDLLRMAPGVNVAQINAHTWAISIRGFNSRYSNKVRVLIDGEEARLTPREYQLLRILARHAGQVVTHRQIVTAVWGTDSNADAQFARVLVAQLRQKVESDPSNPRLLLTEPGVGYRLHGQAEE